VRNRWDRTRVRSLDSLALVGRANQEKKIRCETALRVTIISPLCFQFLLTAHFLF
jgi:hypothetical protein